MSELVKFLFDGAPVRGAIVRLTDAWVEVLSRRRAVGEHPSEVRTLLGEMTAAAVLMQANIKFNGALVLQIFGDGPVKLAVAEVQPDLRLRATAKVVGEVPPGSQLQGLLNLHGHARCTITLDPKTPFPGQQPYQGVVPLQGGPGEPPQRMQQLLEHYMRQSEQLDTRLVLAASDSVAAGLLIQRLPAQGAGKIEVSRPARDEGDIGPSEDFERIALLAATLTHEELLNLRCDQILHRLFWQEAVRVFAPATPSFACSCSRQRVSRMLRELGREESESLIAERGEVEVGCEFCGLQYRFDAVDVGEMFTPERDQPPGTQAVQ